jgi:hypothetical protein
MFRVVLPSIIRSAYKCIYSIWYLSHRYCYLPLSWKSWNRFECAVGGVTGSNSSTIAADSSNGVTNTRCCKYIYMRSWWWMEVLPETCRAFSGYRVFNLKVDRQLRCEYFTSDAIYNSSAGMTLYYYMCRSWQDCCRRGENKSWPSVSVESVDSECWCLNNATFTLP